MKNLWIVIFSFLGTLQALAQVRQAQLILNWQSDSLANVNAAYSEVWGLSKNGSEIAVIGSKDGTHFIDVTQPNSARVVGFIPDNKRNVSYVHRDYHDYGNYLYIVADELPASLQIVDLSNLPNSIELVYNSNSLFSRAHNIFIDAPNKRLYACGNNSETAIIALNNPIAPVKIGSFNNVYVHDLYVKDNIAYLNAGQQGLYIVDFTNAQQANILSVLSDYPEKGYNHSGYLSEDGTRYFMADETWGMDIKVVDVTDLTNPQVTATFNNDDPSPYHIPHNLLVKGDSLYVSYYHQGLQVFDISNPDTPVRVLEYDTYAGATVNNFKGAWGVYPFFESGNVLLSDIQSGLYVFDVENTLSTVTNQHLVSNLFVSPNPCSDFIEISLLDLDEFVKPKFVELVDHMGKVVFFSEKNVLEQAIRINTSFLPKGFYVLRVATDNGVISKKILKL